MELCKKFMKIQSEKSAKSDETNSSDSDGEDEDDDSDDELQLTTEEMKSIKKDLSEYKKKNLCRRGGCGTGYVERSDIQ